MASQSENRATAELKRILKKVGGYVATFLAGGICTFAYSYLPLHQAKLWRIDYLEERLAAKIDHADELERQLQTALSQLETRPDPEALEVVQEELDRTDSVIHELESKLAQAERRAKQAERARNSWRQKHEQAESEKSALAAELDASAPGDEEASTDATRSAPAAPAASPSPRDDAFGAGGPAAPVPPSRSGDALGLPADFEPRG